jgi:Fur family ferric uptake transcriptional regulator
MKAETKGATATNALEAFEAYLRSRGHKLTRPRRLVAETHIAARRHIGADDLIAMLHDRGTPVGKATVYRTLALMRECGYFDAHDFDQGRRLYEPMMGRAHHDHLYCISCGDVIEFSEPRIEKLQDDVVHRHGFTAVYHSHKIFGYCRECGRGKPRHPDVNATDTTRRDRTRHTHR